MALPDIKWLEKVLAAGKIKRLDAYVGEIFIKSYEQCWIELGMLLRKYGGRVCVCRNHAKIFAGTGSKYDFAIESSANINTNPRIENTTINISTEMYCFYKDFFDGLKSYDHSFDNWEKWEKP